MSPIIFSGLGCLYAKQLTPLLDPSDKKRVADCYVNTVGRWVEHRISNEKLRDTLWSNYQGFDDVVFLSPCIYFIYHGIHPSGFTMEHHAWQALYRGLIGSISTVPVFAGMYGVSAVALPVIQSEYMKYGVSEERAKPFAEATVVLGLAAPIACAAEAIGCGVSFKQMRSRLFPMATVLISMRLATSILLQGLASEHADHQYRDLAIPVVGTTVVQHGINATMQSLSYGQRFSDVLRYLKFGTGDSYRSGLKQFCKASMQGAFFAGLLYTLKGEESPRPEWARN